MDKGAQKTPPRKRFLKWTQQQPQKKKIKKHLSKQEKKKSEINVKIR